MHVRDEHRRRIGREPPESVPAAHSPELARMLAAGNANVTAYLQRAAVGWADGIAINKGPKTSAGFTRFPIGDLSSGLAPDPKTDKFEENGGGFKSATVHTSEKPYQRGIVLVPTALLKTPPADIDVLFHLHGHGIGWREGIKDADDKSAPVGFAFKGKVRDEAAEDIENQLPPTMVAVMPQGTRASGFGAVAPQAMILEALHAVPGWDKVVPKRVVLGAYSGGGGSLPSVLGSDETKRDDRVAERQKDLPKLAEVAVFDAINGPNELASMVKFVNDQLSLDIEKLQGLDDAAQRTYLESSMRLRAFFSAGSPTYGPLYTDLFNQTVAAKGLWAGEPASAKKGRVPKALSAKIAQEVWELLAANYVIAPRGQGHPTKLAGGNLKEAVGALTPGAGPAFP